jgi:hypothetical protein
MVMARILIYRLERMEIEIWGIEHRCRTDSRATRRGVMAIKGEN